METCNARIVKTFLGIEDHGMLTAMVTLDYGSSQQGFGGYRLDTPKGPSEACGLFIARTMATVGVDSWESLVGKIVRVQSEGRMIHAIGHVIEDRWFVPKAEMK